MFKLSRPELMEIRSEDGAVYPGGDQDWFTGEWQRMAGCAPTTCAAVVRYLAETQEQYRALCDGDEGERSGFLRRMEAIWEHMTPGRMGTNSTLLYIEGAVRYAESRSVTGLGSKTLDVPEEQALRPDIERTAKFIADGLGRDLPVLFLNLCNGDLENLDSWHWVTITALEPKSGVVTAFDNGLVLELDLELWLRTSRFGGGFLYFLFQEKVPRALPSGHPQAFEKA